MSRVLDKSAALIELEAERLRLGLATDGCMMCALTRGGALGAPIAETKAGLLVLDRFGSRAGHLLVVSKAHVHSPQELGWQRYSELQRLAFDASLALQRVLSPLRVWIAALGAPETAPMSFPHFHLHVLPIYEGGEISRPARVFSWSEGVVTYSENEAFALTRELRDAFRSENGLSESAASNVADWGLA